MQASALVSTQFITMSNAHQVGVLVTLNADRAVRRPPINVALVLDRSGSMDGAPLEAAKDAAVRFAQFLTPQDRLSVVAFDDNVTRVWGPGQGGAPDAIAAIQQIQAGGSTNLSGGWLEGMALVAAGKVDGTNRVVLLTDGQANVGLVDPAQLAGLSQRATDQSVSTTCIGFGAHFNEDLLTRMARFGRGNFWYVEEIDQMAAIFSQEIEGLVALTAQNVAIEVNASHPAVPGVSFLQPFDVTRTPSGGWRVPLGDLYASSPRSLGIVFHVENLATLGQTELGSVVVEAHLVNQSGIELRTITMPIVANLDGTSHPDPVVESTFLRFQVAQAREEAVRHADQGDLAEAALTLREAVAKIDMTTTDEDLVDARDDLAAEASRLEANRYDRSDRKYHVAQSMAAYEQKESYRKVIRRKR